MRKLALTVSLGFALLCGVWSKPVSAGDPHTPGADPTPSPCPEQEICFGGDGGGVSSATATDGSLLLVDGALLIINSLPF